MSDIKTFSIAIAIDTSKIGNVDLYGLYDITQILKIGSDKRGYECIVAEPDKTSMPHNLYITLTAKRSE